jgi:hypothetical protein
MVRHRLRGDTAMYVDKVFRVVVGEHQIFLGIADFNETAFAEWLKNVPKVEEGSEQHVAILKEVKAARAAEKKAK